MKKTALHDTHVAMQAKMTPFGGYNMPVWYTSIKEEHEAVRKNVGVFDISHMGVLKVIGPTAFESLQHLTCNDIAKAKQKMIYSMILTETGTILDDIMLGELAPQTFIVVVNASNLTKILNWITPRLTPGTQVQDLTATHGLLAIQGPKAAETLSKILKKDLTTPQRFSLFADKDITYMRTGYTGEDGYELSIPNEKMGQIWQSLIDAGITPCGLGARDTLRLEAGLPLYGQELSESINPLMTRYKWVLKFYKDFIGKEALEKKSSTQTTVGIIMKDRIIPRTGYRVQEGGHITSGTLSPSLDTPIALALVEVEHATIGNTLNVEIRGKFYPGTIVKVPFI